MGFFAELITNKIFVAPTVAWIVAQLIKMLVDVCKYGFNKENIYAKTGMPSSLAALVSAFIIITGIIYGGGSFEFALTFFVGFITLYDSRGVRYETSRHGKALNNLNEEREEEGKQPLDIIRFKEKVGHTLPELVAGILVGLVCAIIIFYLPF